MPMRSFRRISGRRPRRKTRWLAITPGVVSGAASPSPGTYSVSTLALQDRAGAVDWNEFYGGTLLRVILDVQIAHTINNAGGIQVGTVFLHGGLLLSPEVSPTATAWDPNVPSGSFMERQTFGEEVALQYGAAGLWYRGKQDGFAFHFDTNVKRKIQENDRLFAVYRGFLGGTAWTGVDLGHTGRVLIQLP